MRRTLAVIGLTALLAGTISPTALTGPAFGSTPAVVASAPSMEWSAVKTNGGGWVTGMVTGPTGEVYSRTDVGGAYRWNAADQAWEQMLTSPGVPSPNGGDYAVESLAVARTNGQIVYAAVGWGMQDGSGRILRSADGGRTWRDGGARMTIHGNAEWRWAGERLSVDPSNPDIVLFGSRRQGIMRTEDGGLTGSRLIAPTGAPVGHEPAGTMFTLFDPASPVVNGRTQGAWAGVQDVGLLRTDDAGRTWRVVHAITNGVPRDVELASNGMLYVAVHGQSSQVLRLNTGTGVVTNVSPSPGGAFAMVAVDPSNPSRVFVGDAGVRDGKLWRSLDGGTTWTALGIALADVPGGWTTTTDLDQWMSGGALAFDPARPGMLWFAEGMGMWTSKDLSDAEVTWTFTSDGIEELVANTAVKPPGKPLITASWDRGLFRHPTPGTGGATLPYTQSFGSAWDLAASPTDPNFLVTVLDDHQDLSGRQHPDRRASGYSVDGGATWTRFGALARGTAPSDLLFGNIAVSAVDSNNIVWAPSNVPSLKMYYTKDKGDSWAASSLAGATAGDYLHPVHYLRREGLAADSMQAGHFYALGGNYDTGDTVLWKTTDGGGNWARVVTTGLNRSGYWDSRYHAQLAVLPGRPGHMIVLAGRTEDASRPFWRSTDGGRTWTEKSNLLDAHSLGIGAPLLPGGNPTLFTYGTVSGVRGLYRSSDFGDSWEFLTGYVRGWYQDITSIVGDPEVPGKVYVGFTGGGFAFGQPTGTAGVPTSPVPTTPVPTSPVPTTPVPTTPVPASPVPTTPVPTTPVPTTPAPVVTPSPTATPAPPCRATGSKPTGKKAERCTPTTVLLSNSIQPKASSITARRASAVSLSIAVMPRRAGERVALQRRIGSTWRTVGSAVTSTNGRATFRFHTSRTVGATTLRFAPLVASALFTTPSSPFVIRTR